MKSFLHSILHSILLISTSLHSSSPYLFPSSSHLSSLCLVLTVFGEEMAEDICTAAGDMDQWALFSQTQARRDSQHQCDGLYDQSPLSQIPSNYETTQDGLDLQENIEIFSKKLVKTGNFHEIVFGNSFFSLKQTFLACLGGNRSFLEDPLKPAINLTWHLIHTVII